MIAFKFLRSAREFGTLDPRLSNVIIPEIMDRFDLEGVPTLIVTSVYRASAITKDHPEYRAVDLRTWSFTRSQCLSMERAINALFPVPPGQRPTIKFYDMNNSPYPAHFHVRVPKLESPLTELGNNENIDHRGPVL